MSEPYRNPDDDLTVPSQAQGASPTEPAAKPVYSTKAFTTHYPPAPPPTVYRESSARLRVKQRRKQGRHSLGEWAWVIVAATLFGVVMLVSISVLVVVRSAQEVVEILPTASIPDILPTPLIAHTTFSDGDLGETLILPDGSSIALTPWDGQSRFTVVLAGLDRRPNERGLAYRTDTMMIASLDPATRTLSVLSIPRDLYVQVPGYAALQRINSPMVFGETRQPNYGPVLMMQTVQLNFGIRVHDYIVVDFQAFIDIVNAIGGITITSEYTINDPLYPNMNYGYDPFYLAAGTHQLDGYNALRYARTRHGDSDIRRAERQQQVLYAVRDKVLNFNMLPTLVFQAPALWNTLSNNVYTGLSLEQIIQLALYLRDIPRENIRMGVLTYEYLRPYTTPDGASVLIPDRARLANLMVDIFGANYSQ